MEMNRPYADRVWHLLLAATALVPAWLFALGAIAKFSDPTKPLVFIQGSLKIPYPWSRWLIVAIAAAEIVVAVWLAFSLGRSARPGIAALMLVSFFAGLLLAVAGMHPRTGLSCPCFGELQPPLGGRSIMGQFKLDAFLAGVLFFHVFAAFLMQRRPIVATMERRSLDLPEGNPTASGVAMESHQWAQDPEQVDAPSR